MVNHNRAICPECHRVFAKEKEDQKYCSQCQETFDFQKLNKPNQKCIECNTEFYTPNKSDNFKCPFCTIKRYSKRTRKPKDYSESNLKEKKKPNSKFIPYEERIRRQEWRRVWDDKGWSHYLKGRKWDKI